MKTAIFAVPIINSQPQLPPFESDDPLEPVIGRVQGHGTSLLGQVPSAPTCNVRIRSSAAGIAAMKADPRYLWIEDVEEVEDA